MRLSEVKISEEWISIFGQINMVGEPGESWRSKQHKRIEYQQHARDWQPIEVLDLTEKEHAFFDAFGLGDVIKVGVHNEKRSGEYFTFPSVPGYEFQSVTFRGDSIVIACQVRKLINGILFPESQLWPGNEGLRQIYRMAVEKEAQNQDNEEESFSVAQSSDHSTITISLDEYERLAKKGLSYDLMSSINAAPKATSKG